MNSFSFLFFLFINIFNPISIYLTLGFDVILYFILLNSKSISNKKIGEIVIIVSLFITLWSVLVILINFSLDLYVLVKYTKIFIITILFHHIMQRQKFPPEKFIKILSFVLFSHVLSVGLQIIFPSLIIPMAKFFDFGRMEVLTDRTFRLLGFCGSYDTASFISILSMVLFLLKFKFNGGWINLILATVSYLSTIRISRMGMLIGGIVFIIFIFYLLFNSKFQHKIYTFILLILAIIIISNYALPILVSTSGLFDDHSSSDISSLNIGNEYGSGTANSLINGSNLDILKLPLLNLIIGFGTDSSDIQLGHYSTDIGYFEIISHIGIIGLLLVLFIYFYIFRTIYRYKTNFVSKELLIIRNFILIFIIIACVMNYKLLIVYGRGSHDLLLILFYYYIFQFSRYERFKIQNSISLCKL